MRRNDGTAFGVRWVTIGACAAICLMSGAARAYDEFDCNDFAHGCVYAVNSASSYPLAGGVSILGDSSGDWAGTGVYGKTSNGSGVAGSATTGIGVQGFSNSSGTGVLGSSSSSVGVQGTIGASSDGSAVYGEAQGSWTAWAGNYDGDVQARGYYNTSDARLKAEIQTLAGGAEQLKRLRPVTYKWKADGASGSTQVGLIAQEVQQVLPSAVRADGKSGMLSVNYAQVLPVMIKAIQEQQAKIEALEQQQHPLGASLLFGSRLDGMMLFVAGAGLTTLLSRWRRRGRRRGA